MSTGDSVRVVPHDSDPPRVPDDRSHRQHSTDGGDRGDHGNRWNPHQREGKRPVPFLEASGVRDGGDASVVPRRIYQGYWQDHAGLPSPFRRGMKPSVRVISSHLCTLASCSKNSYYSLSLSWGVQHFHCSHLTQHPNVSLNTIIALSNLFCPQITFLQFNYLFSYVFFLLTYLVCKTLFYL